MIRKILLTVFVAFAALTPALAAAPAYAVDILNNQGDAAGPCSNANAASKPGVCTDNRSGAGAANPIFGPTGVITSAINILSVVIGIVAVIIIVIEGIRMIAAAGDAGTAATARRGIVYACIGIAVALMAQAIVVIVLNRVG